MEILTSKSKLGMSLSSIHYCQIYTNNSIKKNPVKASRDQTTLDFLIGGQRIEVIIRENFQLCFDYNILIWDVTFKATSKLRGIYVPNKKLAKEIDQSGIIDQSVTNAMALSGTSLNLKKLRRKKTFTKIKPKK